jgi:hypothetical protein
MVPKLEYRCWNQNSNFEIEIRIGILCRNQNLNQNSNFDIKTKIKILISTLKFQQNHNEILSEFRFHQKYTIEIKTKIEIPILT